MESFIDFFNHPFFIIVGGLSTLLAIISVLYIVYLVMKGVLPVWYRIGIGLSKRKIAILAENSFNELKNVLIDSKLFGENNIDQIDKNSLSKLESYTLILVHWKEFENEIKEILRYKNDSDALVVYAPRNEGTIPDKYINKINNERNTVVVNFRGRLLNDILTSMVTTIYAKRKY
ncbi:MAG: hypothetical protein GWP19_14185 [Planctomycetia bacterium]|nr:hypothetical protein [Planctomycetia bacterium]